MQEQESLDAGSSNSRITGPLPEESGAIPLPVPKKKHKETPQAKARRLSRYRTDPVYREIHKQRAYRCRAKKKPLIKAKVLELKSCGCKICGEKEPCCLDFHHNNPAEKEFILGIANSCTKSMESLEREAAKCTVLCSNCHRKFHAGLVKLPIQEK